MKKSFCTIFALAILSSILFSQGCNRSTRLNIDAGFDLAGIAFDASVTQAGSGLQFGYNDKISIDCIIGYVFSNYKFSIFFGDRTNDWSYTDSIFGANGEYHLLEPNNNLLMHANQLIISPAEFS